MKYVADGTFRCLFINGTIEEIYWEPLTVKNMEHLIVNKCVCECSQKEKLKMAHENKPMHRRIGAKNRDK